MEDAPAEPTASVRLVDKLRWFVRECLDEEEFVLFGALLAPGIAAAYADAGTEVEGFQLTRWAPSTIPDELAAVLREKGIRVSGLDP